MRIDNINQFTDRLRKLSRDQGELEPVVVGYAGTNYAIFVHEDMQARHKEGKQAKFLEAPARQLSPVLGDLVGRAVAGGASLQKALLIAGMRLQRDSQKLVPVDTGNLRGSAFTVLESMLETATNYGGILTEARTKDQKSKEAKRKTGRMKRRGRK